MAALSTATLPVQVHPGGPAPLPLRVVQEERLRQAKHHVDHAGRYIRERNARRSVQVGEEEEEIGASSEGSTTLTSTYTSFPASSFASTGIESTQVAESLLNLQTKANPFAEF